MRKQHKVVSVLGVLTLAAAVLVAPAVPAQAIYYPRITAYQLRQRLMGRELGPNRYTHYATDTIVGFRLVRIRRDGRKVWKARRVVTPPDASVMVRTNPDGSARPMLLSDWWNPISWDWGGIFGAIWHKITQCLSGAKDVLLPTVPTAVAAKLLFRGFKLIGGFQSWAVLMIGGCITAVEG